jgi:hypothetical protein
MILKQNLNSPRVFDGKNQLSFSKKWPRYGQEFRKIAKIPPKMGTGSLAANDSCSSK